MEEKTIEQIGKLYQENEKLIAYTIKKFFGSYEGNKEELNDVASDGLLNAIKTYDENKNITFGTYAITCIKNNILKFFYVKNLIKNQTERHTISINEPYIRGDGTEDDITIETSILMQDPYSFVDHLVAKEEVKDVLNNFKYLTPGQQICLRYSVEYDGERSGDMRKIYKQLGFTAQNFSLKVIRAKQVLNLIYKQNKDCTIEELQEKAKILRKKYPIVTTIEDFHKYKNSNNKNIKSVKEK